MKKLTFAPLAILAMILLISGAGLSETKDAISYTNDTAIPWFPKIDTATLSASENVDFIPNLKAYQQTTD